VTESLSFFERFFLAWGWFFRALGDGRFAARVQGAARGELPAAERPSLPPMESPRRPAEPVAPAVDVAAVRRDSALGVLALLQREGRLIDFLEQDIASFADADVGAAARLVHDGCRKALRSHVSIAAVANATEGEKFVVEPGYAPAAFKLTGNVTGAAPYRGILRHKGWRAASCSLPEPAPGHDASVLAPAEVEL
jgi:hypothetical protein